jgi:hypothetical protein
MIPIGILKTTISKNCEICNYSKKITIKENIYENTEEAKEKAKKIIKAKINKSYTCNICKAIIKNN